jgi:hypothetical protein
MVLPGRLIQGSSSQLSVAAASICLAGVEWASGPAVVQYSWTSSKAGMAGGGGRNKPSLFSSSSDHNTYAKRTLTSKRVQHLS